MRRAQMQRPQFHEVIDLDRELTATKYCSHPVHSDCEGPIVKAHTVPKKVEVFGESRKKATFINFVPTYRS
jgi:hypothetical protein